MLCYAGRRQQTGPMGPHVGVWCILLLVLDSSPLLASPAEEKAYTAVQQIVATGAQARTISDARAFLQRFPHSAERAQVLFWLAEALYATRSYREAAAVYQELLHETPAFPDAATALHRLGLSSLYSRHYNAALAAFTQLLAQFPHVKEPERIVFHMVTSYFEQGRFDAALPLYQQLLQEAAPPVSVATLHVRLGDGYFYQQQVPRALQHYQLVLQEFPESGEALQARYQLGAVALVQQQFEAARQHFRAIVHTAARGLMAVQAHYALAWTLYHQGQVAQAVAYLRQQGLLAQPSATDTVLAQGVRTLAAPCLSGGHSSPYTSARVGPGRGARAVALLAARAGLRGRWRLDARRARAGRLYPPLPAESPHRGCAALARLAAATTGTV